MSQPKTLSIPDWLITMPKVELHVHLEGTISPELLVELSNRHTDRSNELTLEDARGFYRYENFPQFINAFMRVSDAIKSPEDLEKVVLAYGEDLAKQNVRYAEMHYNPEPHLRRKHIPMRDGLTAMNRAREVLLARHGLELRWICDGIRDADIGADSVDITIDWIEAAGPDSGIVALGLGGNEIEHPASKFTHHFRRAKDLGLNIVAHAGEALGPESIRETIEYLQPARIGHGISAVHDTELMAQLAERKIPLEISPSSNVRTGVIDSYESLPLQAFRNAGVRFSINSDDPPLFGTTLTREYAIAAKLMNLDQVGVAQIVADAIEDSFASGEVKQRLQDELATHTPEIRGYLANGATASSNSR